MNDLVTQALFPVNLPFTILLAGLVAYWALVSFGLFSAEGSDIADADASVDDAGGPWGAYLQFINVGDVPLMIVLTVLALTMWLCGILANFFLNDGSILLGLAYLVPSFVLSTVVTRYVTMPLKKISHLLHQPEPGDRPLIGQTCIVRTRDVSARYGQAEIAGDGAPLLIQVRAPADQPLHAGDTALIISQDAATGTYSVVKVTPETLEK